MLLSLLVRSGLIEVVPVGLLRIHCPEVGPFTVSKLGTVNHTQSLFQLLFDFYERRLIIVSDTQ